MERIGFFGRLWERLRAERDRRSQPPPGDESRGVCREENRGRGR